MVIKNGNVGIGTTEPAGKLDIRGATAPVLNIQRDLAGGASGLIYSAAQMKLTTPTPATNNGIGFYFSAPNAAGTDKTAGLFGGRLSTITAGSEVGDILFQSSWQGTGAGDYPHLLIRATSATTGNVLIPNGNVGIGTTAPVLKTDIVGALYLRPASTLGLTSEALRLGRSDSDIRYHSIYSVGNNGVPAENQLQFRIHNGADATAQVTTMTLAGNGNVGIGTTTPATKLDVNGVVTIRSGGSANHAICWKSDGITLGYCSSVVASDGACTCN
jgi:hypothetical protein